MRLRRTATIDPGIERELQALDAALAGEPVDVEFDDLRDLAVALRAERPAPPAELIESLDSRVEDGFPKPERAPARSRWRVAPLALATGAAVFVVAVAVVSAGLLSGGGDDRRRETAAPAAKPGVIPLSGGRGERLSAQPSPASPVRGCCGPATRPRKVERAASITLATPSDEIEDVADGVVRTADRYGGFVLRSSVKSGERAPGATIDLRIPAGRLTDAIADISELAHVRARTQRTRDITARFAYPRRELADATAERRALLAQLARATTPNETASIRARLRIANDRIDAARATLRGLQRRVGYASIAVSVEPGAPRAGGGGWSAGDALGTAADVLRVSAGVLIVALAALIPLTLLLTLAYAARRVYVDRARAAALDAVENRPAR